LPNHKNEKPRLHGGERSKSEEYQKQCMK